MMNWEDWSEDRAYEIIIDDLQACLIEYSDRLADYLLEDFNGSNWQSFAASNSGRNVHSMLLLLSEWYLEDNKQKLLEEYDELLEDSKNDDNDEAYDHQKQEIF